MKPDFHAIRESILDKQKKNTVLIAAHRGTHGGNIVQNTIPAFQNALIHQADILEVDASMTRDGVFYAFHDGHEADVMGVKKSIKKMTAKEVDGLHLLNSVTHKISRGANRLDEIIDFIRDKDTLINIDRSWFYWKEILSLLKRHNLPEKIFIKSPPKPEFLDYLEDCGVFVMYMPIISNMKELELVKSKKINLLGVELIFQDGNSELISEKQMEQYHTEKLLVWGNAITLDDRHHLSGDYTDDYAILRGPGETWGWLIKRGFTILQTDWPLLMKQYLLSMK